MAAALSDTATARIHSCQAAEHPRPPGPAHGSSERELLCLCQLPAPQILRFRGCDAWHTAARSCRPHRGLAASYAESTHSLLVVQVIQSQIQEDALQRN